ncbi:MAG: lytic transglycosylase domain-containing protein [Roseinatronobacter sp.]
MLRSLVRALAAPALSLTLAPGLALGLALGLGAMPHGASAEAETFSFRRIAVPAQVDGPRITVQIDPEEQARRLAVVRPRAPVILPEVAAPRAPASGYAWFWDHVPARLQDSPGRFLAAIRVLETPPGPGKSVRAPRMQALQDIAAVHGADILRASVGTNVSPALVLAVIAVESAGRAQAVSSAGAQGLMQLIPATAARFGVQDAFDTRENIRGGVSYLDWLLRHFDNDVVLALAGYNAGEGAVRRNSGVPPFAETRDYVPKVLAAWLVARGLCTVPPELPSDGCIFRIGQAG